MSTSVLRQTPASAFGCQLGLASLTVVGADVCCREPLSYEADRRGHGSNRHGTAAPRSTLHAPRSTVHARRSTVMTKVTSDVTFAITVGIPTHRHTERSGLAVHVVCSAGACVMRVLFLGILLAGAAV
jgi:hypothetical protein